VAQSQLSPPNHNLVNVGLSVSVTPSDASLQLMVYANDNASPSDAADIGPATLQLRSERQGNGDGRVYLIVARERCTPMFRPPASGGNQLPMRLAGAGSVKGRST
jgi:hypothetical protein